MSGADQSQAPLASGQHVKTPELWLESACARLKAAGLRVTQPRLAILSALIRTGRPRSIEAIHQELGPHACDVVTVYRCMAAFEAIGVVRRAFLHNGTCLYALDLGEPIRYHVVCKATRQVAPIDEDASAELGQALHRVEERLRAQGYTHLEHIVEFFGVAPTVATAPTAPALPSAASAAGLPSPLR
jgi:Fur family ferric uptake transcriptional regulator